MGNEEYGFALFAGRGNRIQHNAACDNWILDAFEAPDVKGNVWLRNRFCTGDI